MTLVFLHVDKTGGMSVREMLARHYPADAIRPVPHHPEATYQPASYPTIWPDLYRANRQFEHQAAHELVMGHYDWSIIEKMLLQGHDRPMVITVLREPVQRAASLWRWMCREEAMFGENSVRARDLGFDRWARLYPGLYANVMTQQLACCRWNSVRDEHHATVFALAVNHLRQCALVGLTEALDDFAWRLADLMGWDRVESAPRVNRAETTVDVSEDTADCIRRESCWDVELYELVRWKYGA